jgi:TonB-linked SusC/RagA family outer membrane protein
MYPLAVLLLICLVFPSVSTAETALPMYRENIVVTGIVTDESGAPLIEANVFIVGQPLGSVTDQGGKYRFILPETLLDETLQLRASYVGYKSSTKRVTVTRGSNTNDFSLAIDVMQMEAIVATAMGIGLTKDKIGVRIDRVSQKEIVNSDESNVVAALSGKVANVEVTGSSGEPGAGVYLRIRGVNSITRGTPPLFVVDGTPINNQSLLSANKSMDLDVAGVTQQNRASDLNPEDIESIEVLKGAAASAMYGSRAANGVLLITTKSGKPGRTRLSYKISFSFDEVNHSVPLQRIFGQGDGDTTSSVSVSWGPKLSDLGSESFDHSREMFETGHKFENNLAVSGGTDRTTYYLSFGRTNINGSIKGNSDYVRDAFRLKATQMITDKLSLTGNVAISDIESNRIQKGSNTSGLLLAAYRTPPDFNNLPYKDSQTGFHRSYQNPNPTSMNGTRGFDNPFFTLNEQTNVSKVDRFFGNAKLDYDPVDWLNLTYTLGYDFSGDERQTVLPQSSSMFPEGRVVRDEFKTRETDGNLVIRATRHYGRADMDVNLTLGHNLNQQDFRAITSTGDGIAVDGFNLLDGTASTTSEERKELVRTEGYFAQAMVGLWQQLYLTAGLRNDGTSVFSPGKKRHWYPKVSTAWDFSSFARNQSWLNFGKLRLAYGQTGRAPGAYSTLTGYAAQSFEPRQGELLSSSAYGNVGVVTDRIRGQEDIKPERAKEYEMGLDVGLINNRMGLELTYYNQKTTDVIYALPVPPSTGFGNEFRNAGTITNKGIEGSITARMLDRKNLKWTLEATYARNRNMVNELPGVEFISLGPFEGSSLGGGVAQGKPVGVFRGNDHVRLVED